MLAIAYLALVFATIIVAGTAAAWIHDVIEARVTAAGGRASRSRAWRPERPDAVVHGGAVHHPMHRPSPPPRPRTLRAPRRRAVDPASARRGLGVRPVTRLSSGAA